MIAQFLNMTSYMMYIQSQNVIKAIHINAMVGYGI